VLLAASAGGPVEAQTESRPIEIRIDGPEGCSSADAFFNSLRSRTTRVRPASEDESRTIIDVRLSRERGRVQGELRVLDDGGQTDTRKVEGASCDEVVQALSLSVALALDPSALFSPAPPAAIAPGPASDRAVDDTVNDTPDSRAPDSAKPDAPSEPRKPVEVRKPVEPGATVPPAASPDTRPLPRIELAAQVIGLAMLADGMSPGVGVSVRKPLFPGNTFFRPSFGLGILYARNHILHTPTYAESTLAGATVQLCPLQAPVGLVTVRPCVVGLAGRLSVRGSQLPHVNTVDHLWLSGGMTLNVAVYVGAGLSIELEAGFTAPLPKRRFFASAPTNIVTETPTLSPLAGLGLLYGM
jgi:hypothetical protein